MGDKKKLYIKSAEKSPSPRAHQMSFWESVRCTAWEQGTAVRRRHRKPLGSKMVRCKIIKELAGSSILRYGSQNRVCGVQRELEHFTK